MYIQIHVTFVYKQVDKRDSGFETINVCSA